MGLSEQIEVFVRDVPRLSSFAGVVGKLETVLREPNSALEEVAEVLGQDQALTARLLRLANSSFFGFPNRLETIQEAVSLIGMQQVQDLVWASTVIRMFSGIPSECVTMHAFWKHSLGCGIASRALAILIDAPRPEKLFVGGLLHDIGRLVLYTKHPEKTRAIFELRKMNRMLLREAEVKVLGFDHTQIGEHLMRQWNFPPHLVNAVRWHHHPMSSDASQLDASIVHLADYLVHAMGLETSGETFIPPLEAKAWDRLNLPLGQLENILESVGSQTAAVERALMGPMGRRSSQA